MIDRGALIVASATGHYRGVHRAPLDAISSEKRHAKLRSQYREALAEGDCVIDDLDVAIALAKSAREAKLDVEVIVFEVPQEPFVRGALPIVIAPPENELVFLGYDVIEVIEPFVSLLSVHALAGVNPHGLFAARAAAETIASVHNAEPSTEDRAVAVRVWHIPTL
ncbi:MAG: hypothetical protein Q8Q09_12980 [Deltaproteobacteria bacterium]|nr:hypothetical protein [Deltaproteobacteria bacterium]